MTLPEKEFIRINLEEALRLVCEGHPKNARPHIGAALDCLVTVEAPDSVPRDPTLTPPLLRLLLDTVPPGWAFTFHRPDDKGC